MGRLAETYNASSRPKAENGPDQNALRMLEAYHTPGANLERMTISRSRKPENVQWSGRVYEGHIKSISVIYDSADGIRTANIDGSQGFSVDGNRLGPDGKTTGIWRSSGFGESRNYLNDPGMLQSGAAIVRDGASVMRLALEELRNNPEIRGNPTYLADINNFQTQLAASPVAALSAPATTVSSMPALPR